MKNNEIQDKNTRTRNWTFLIYPESTVPNWRERLEKLYVSALISPLHDKDLNEDKTPKKAHYHILLMFDNVKSYEQILKITKSFNATIPQICQSPKGLARYMTHMDNKEKYQYKKADIVVLNGADLTELLKPSSQDRYTMISEMLQFISDNSITEFEDILTYARLKKYETWFPLLCDNSAYIIGLAINSKRNRYEKKGQVLIDDRLIDIQSGEFEKITYLSNGEIDEEKE